MLKLEYIWTKSGIKLDYICIKTGLKLNYLWTAFGLKVDVWINWKNNKLHAEGSGSAQEMTFLIRGVGEGHHVRSNEQNKIKVNLIMCNRVTVRKRRG